MRKLYSLSVNQHSLPQTVQGKDNVHGCISSHVCK